MTTKTSLRIRKQRPTAENRPLSKSEVAAELKRVAIAPVASLRNRFKELFDTQPPTAFGADLLRRSITHYIQTKAHGDLSAKSQRALNHAIKCLLNTPSGALDISRRIKTGSELVKEWKGKTYRIIVLADGFSYNGKKYASLSEIASHITGTNWNGPRFFGLRATSKGSASNDK